VTNKWRPRATDGWRIGAPTRGDRWAAARGSGVMGGGQGCQPSAMSRASLGAMAGMKSGDGRGTVRVWIFKPYELNRGLGCNYHVLDEGQHVISQKVGIRLGYVWIH
jgi:hypothetical protein